MESSDAPTMNDLLKEHITIIKRQLFSRSLRILPLPDQVGIVEALAFIVDKAPALLPITDQHLLAFFSELLKMMAIADGEMASDRAGSVGVAVDKDGHVSSASSSSPYSERTASASLGRSYSHASAIFLRGEFSIGGHGMHKRVVVPAEPPLGVQLRVTALVLFRSVIRQHTNTFFDADPSTQIGKHRSILLNECLHECLHLY